MKPQILLNNYDTSIENPNPDENMMNLAIFGPYVNEDPMNYEDATKVDI